MADSAFDDKIAHVTSVGDYLNLIIEDAPPFTA